MKSRFAAFTLVEMIVVLGIVGAMMNLSFGTAYSTISSQQAVQASRSLIQDVRLARLQAMDLQKLPSETWVHGVGIDLRDINTKGRYIVFQLLATPPASQPLTTYTPFPATPVFGSYTEDSISGGISGSPTTGRMKPFSEKFPVVLAINMNNTEITRTCNDPAKTPIAVILFQSLNGKVRLYKEISGNNPLQEITQCDIATITLRSKNVAEYNIIINHKNGDDIYMESHGL